MGAVLYEILAGRTTFEGDKVDTILNQVKTVRPPPPSEVAPNREIPEQLEEIVMRCIEKDPDRRIQSARQLVAALRSWRLRWAAATS
jgi:serine/threonine protein kinase